MIYRTVPKLVTIEGECNTLLGGDPYEIAEILGIDVSDAGVLSSRRLSPRDISYFNKKYPEYMGIWPVITAGVGLVTAGAKGVKSLVESVKSVKSVKTKKKGPQVTGVSAQTAVMRKLADMQKRIKTTKPKATVQQAGMMSMAVPAIALGLGALFLLGRR